MGYPETAEGFMINDQKNWTDFKKQEVSPRTRSVTLHQTTDSREVQAQAI